MLRHYLDDVDLEAEGILLGGRKGGNIAGWLTPPAMAFDEAPLDGIGAVLADVGVMPARTVKIPVSVHPSAGTAAGREAAEAVLTSFLGRLAWLRLDDGGTARELLVRVLEVDLEPAHPGAPTASSGTITLRAPDPRWRVLEPTILTLGTTRVRPTFGTAPVADWVIRLMNPAGAVTDPTITIRDLTGETRTAITLPGTLATTDHLELLAARGLARRWSAGVATLVLTTMVGAFVSLYPGDSLQLSAASGTPTGELLFHGRGW